MTKLIQAFSSIVICTVTFPAAFAQAPTALTVKSATSKRVDLTWTGAASSYNVQRRVLGGSFSTIATVNTTTASDSAIDAYNTFQYQIVAASGSTTPSNPVTVGPPPSGFSVAAPAPGAPGSDLASNYGYDLASVLDSNGDPALAFLFYDPNNDSDPSDSYLIFKSWNRALYKWNDDVKVTLVGDNASSSRPTVSLAYDPTTSVFALATEINDGDSIKLFVSSDGGVTWTLKNTFATAGDSFWGPSLALQNGNIHIAYNRSEDGIKYVTGKLSADPTTWTVKTAPATLPGVASTDTQVAPSLALDSSGVPAVAYFAVGTDGYNQNAFFWRPTTGATPVKITDSQGNQSDEVVVKLLFFGAQPRVLLDILRKDADTTVHFVRSEDGGATWMTPIVIPPDIGSSADYPFDMTFDSQGHGAITFGRNSGSGADVCGNPKVSLSTDLTNWKTCAVASQDITGKFDVYPNSLAILYQGNDKLYLLWQQVGGNPTGVGILLYREPPAGANTNPSLDAGSLHNGATDQPDIVSGNWAQVKGQNLSDQTRIWLDADFNNGNNLPSMLSGVQVMVNNLPASVYYISPTQVNFQVPAGIAPGTANVQVIRNGITSNTISGPAVANAPGLFTYALGGKTYPAAVYANTYTVVGDPTLAGSAVRKAQPGDHIALYATALQSAPAGVIINSASGISGVTATVGASPATVEFAGLVAVGEYQVNILVPALTDGEYPVVIQYNGQSSQTGVIIPIGH